MPYKTSAIGGGKYRVSSPNGVKSRATSKENAKKQVRLLQGIEHGWKPTGKKSAKNKAKK